MPTQTNNRGNFVSEFRWEGGDRNKFEFDLCTPQKGWKQYDTSQDAWYFGIWVNLKQRKIITYAEGDISIVDCPTVASLGAELEAMEKTYRPAPPMAISYDENGQRTEYYDERPKVE